MAHWYRSDLPYNSSHKDAGRCGARVRPVRGGFEWTLWVGEAGRRGLALQGENKSRVKATRNADKAIELCLNGWKKPPRRIKRRRTRR